MTEAYIIGAHSTKFAKRPNDSLKALTREAYLGVLADAGMADGRDIESAWFGNCALHLHNQSSIRGQVCLSPLVQEGLFPERVPVANVDNACATASTAAAGASKDVRSGDAHLSLVIGAEKLFDASNRSFALFEGGYDQLDPQQWKDYYRAAGESVGIPFAPQAAHAVTMDTYAMQAAWHMQRYGTTQRQIAAAAAQCHNYGARNELAQYRFEMSVDQVLEDRPVSYPFTRAMCAPIGDGAAALLICSGEYLSGLAPAVRDRAIRILAMEAAGGKYRRLDEPGLSRVAAAKAYERAGLTAADIDVAEVHDASAFSVIYQAEMLGFCAEGNGGRFVESGETGPGGRIPINTSGGLISKGHPVGATGASMMFELVRQLRGEAGDRQAPRARLALAENGGGVMGFDEAVAVVSILERPGA
ncbi:thiolase family protein [Rhizorhabdus wittichii]|uniref:propanoyl-CoA C-acyltransferase n=1 Tax=Rhizorhabdus wittichii TaxID=160791 RepID=A0A975D1V3_9SPHN|nr:thiolase family protein [Rhizorhabdus wittichii]QTH20200.1 thiolase family protein [Rhizorhabdus wittichii]